MRCSSKQMLKKKRNYRFFFPVFASEYCQPDLRCLKGANKCFHGLLFDIGQCILVVNIPDSTLHQLSLSLVSSYSSCLFVHSISTNLVSIVEIARCYFEIQTSAHPPILSPNIKEHQVTMVLISDCIGEIKKNKNKGCV